MLRKRRRIYHLKAECDVEVSDGRTIARGEEPWMRLEPAPTQWAGRFIEIKYRASLLDEPARPIFRFRRNDNTITDRIGAAPIAGSGFWTGRMPTGTKGLSISPTNRPGPFDFVIEEMRPRMWLGLLARGRRFQPRATRSSLLTRLIGWKFESDVNLDWAISSVPLTEFGSWHAARAAPFEAQGLDRPRFDWSRVEPICIIVLGSHKEEIERTLSSLLKQHLSQWRAFVAADLCRDAQIDPRIETVPACEVLRCIVDRLGQCLVCVLQCGEVLEAHTLAYVAEQARRYPAHQAFYGDVMQASSGGLTTPVFQPGWSPRLQAAASYIVPPFFVRVGAFAKAELGAYLVSGDLPASMARKLSRDDVKPLRRVLATTKRRDPAISSTTVPKSPGSVATIIIPTRDHPALLTRLITSIRARTAARSFDLLVVDNGSVSPAARKLLGELRHASDIRCLHRPGPFDFSTMCNDAAKETQSDVLVFLNDDTEILSAGWLDRLVALAMDPTIGAVGAKLTYPDGRLQHVGVLVGMGESAGHFGAFDTAEAAGWAGRNLTLHEVSAVTGACLAVGRKKFEAVGGFDAEKLPVELSDIDLCLKLNARGWQAVVDPAVHLMHEESASRGGATFRRLDVYGNQRAVFIERWRRILRDDPFFHPGLSLYSAEAALG